MPINPNAIRSEGAVSAPQTLEGNRTGAAAAKAVDFRKLRRLKGVDVCMIWNDEHACLGGLVRCLTSRKPPRFEAR